MPHSLCPLVPMPQKTLLLTPSPSYSPLSLCLRVCPSDSTKPIPSLCVPPLFLSAPMIDSPEQLGA